MLQMTWLFARSKLLPRSAAGWICQGMMTQRQKGPIMAHLRQLQPQWQQQELQQQEQLQQEQLQQNLQLMMVLQFLKLRFPKVVDEVIVLGRARAVGRARVVGRARAVGEVLGAAMDKSMHQALMALGKALRRATAQRMAKAE